MGGGVTFECGRFVVIILYVFSFLLAVLVFFVTRSLPIRKRLILSAATFVALCVLATFSVIKAFEETYNQSDQHPIPTETNK
jgi:hypothetical protein